MVYHVLLTGGVGSRLWPLSRKSRPKQYLKVFNGFSLFELTVKRNLSFSDGLIIVGNKNNHQLSLSNLHDLNITADKEIIEATPRNTAPAIAFAAFSAKPEDVLLVTPSDHIIKEGEPYNAAIREGISLAEKRNIVTFGISPSKPETGYGYIEYRGDSVLSFREKPNEATAKTFLRSGNFLWNSGMFCFKAGVFLEELEKHAPEVYSASLEAWKNNDKGLLGEQLSLDIPAISVDYAVMEHSERIKVVPSAFEWSDMGSFEAVYDYLQEEGHPVDESGNMQIGGSKPIYFTGLRNTIVVDTDDTVLVLRKENSQNVKELYQQLEEHTPHLVD